jgi:predicted  nucleic acid-binding Zn-ribbon protein
MQQQLNTLQQEVADLQSRLDDLAEGNSSSNQQQHVQPQQLQELEQKLKQGNDELAEQVLQLDLQLQMVSVPCVTLWN